MEAQALETFLTLVLENVDPELSRAHREFYPERIPEHIPFSLTWSSSQTDGLPWPSSLGCSGGSSRLPSSLDNGRRSPRKLLRAVVARQLGRRGRLERAAG